MRARRDLIFNPLSVRLSRFLVEWLLSLQEQPALLALSPPVTAYFAWHPLIREQDRLCAQGTFRVGKFWAPIPALRPGLWHTLVPAQDECGIPVALSSSPPTHSINIKVLSIKQKMLPWCTWQHCSVTHSRCSLGSYSQWAPLAGKPPGSWGSITVTCTPKENTLFLKTTWKHLLLVMATNRG